jgi:hypothetical protein
VEAAHYGRLIKIKDMKTMISIIIVGCLSIFYACCNKLFSDEKLTLPKINYDGNELRTDGYYYEMHDNLTTIYFLYRSGIILYAYSHRNKDLKEIESIMLNNNMYENRKDDKARWGIFLINGNTIQFERWDASSGRGLSTFKCFGYLENDTTFYILKTYSSETKKEYSVNWIYHFKQFDNKPDSTNAYIK